MDFTMDCAPGDADALAGSRFNVGRRLACAVDAEIVSRTRVQLKLSRFQRLAGMLFEREGCGSGHAAGAGRCVRELAFYYLNLAAVGSLLLTGSPAETSADEIVVDVQP